MIKRISQSYRAALLHLGISATIALICATLVFGVWYPYPYREISGGRILFQILIVVDVIIGPLLTLILFSPTKSRRELTIDLGVVALLQLAALCYGMWSVAHARPLFLALEGDKYRVVSVADIDSAELVKAPEAYRQLSWGSPQLLGVKLLSSKDPGFPASIQQALEGNHPAYRPERWTDYEKQRAHAAQQAEPIPQITALSKQALVEAETWIATTGKPTTNFGFYPVFGELRSDWLAIIDRTTGVPVHFMPFVPD